MSKPHSAIYNNGSNNNSRPMLKTPAGITNNSDAPPTSPSPNLNLFSHRNSSYGRPYKSP